MCICPKRLLGADLLNDILDNCWPNAKPKNPRVAYEIKMENFGNVDMVVADISEADGSITDFVSVELQAVDTTGSYEPAYQGVLNSRDEVTLKSYGINWKNVRKRLVHS